MHSNLLHNGGIHATSEKLLSPGQVGFMNGWGVFTTIRIYDGCCLLINATMSA